MRSSGVTRLKRRRGEAAARRSNHSHQSNLTIKTSEHCTHLFASIHFPLCGIARLLLACRHREY